MIASRQQSGFVLVLILVLIALCGVIMAASARRSAHNAMQASASMRELQFRWGAASCQAVLLGEAERMFDEALKSGLPLCSEATGEVVLGNMTFNVTVSDESAKANINRLAQQYANNNAGLLAAIDKLQDGGGDLLSVELRETQSAVETDMAGLPMLLTSFDQVFATRNVSELAGSMARRRMTCWGDGRINIRRAELPVMAQVLAGQLTGTQLQVIDRLRRSKEAFSVIDALAAVQLTTAQREAIGKLVTDTSNCHGLWISAEDGARTRRRLYVIQADQGPQLPQRWAFEW